MTVEESRGNFGEEIDRFPVGMRVLAVDDDPTCLLLLDGLLRKCKYQVTTTSQARTALKMLRENRNRFDIVISDVVMPDMDGFKLLELVGLEMDIPVIMLSANSDRQLVMKGVMHGACDYLVKPVRLEELRNIWQHVIRKKKSDPKSQTKSVTQDVSNQGSEDGPETGSADQNVKVNRKRKEEKDEGEENGHDSDDPSTQKKPRVVWSMELHGKFVAAVNQLGIDKAVPKRILDLMNDERLTRENVASHLQKYRLYLKRISMQQPNMLSSYGKDSSYIRMGSLDGLGDFHSLSGSGRLPSAALSSYPTSGMLGRLNSASNISSLHSLTSSPLIQPSHGQNLSNSMSTIGKFQPVVSLANQNTNLFPRLPTFDLDQLQQSRSPTQVGEFNPIITTGSSGSCLTVQRNSQAGGGFTNQSSSKPVSTNIESFLGSSGSTFFEQNRCNDNWQSAMQQSKFSNTLPLSEPSLDPLSPNSLRYNNCLNGFSSDTTIPAPVEDSRCGQVDLVGDLVQNINQPLNQKHVQVKHDYTQYGSNAFSALASLVPANGSVGQMNDEYSGVLGRRTDISFVGISNGGGSSLPHYRENERASTDLKTRSDEECPLEQGRTTNGFVANCYDSLDDLMNSMLPRQEQESTILMDGEYGMDAFTYGQC